jgi:hypothetical protein
MGGLAAARSQLVGVHPFHVAAFVKELQTEFAAGTANQHLAALRMLFGRLVTGHILGVNPDHPVRGPKDVVQKREDAGAHHRGSSRAS